MKPITFICGRICSGKGSYCRTLKATASPKALSDDGYNVHIVSVSDIVGSIIQTDDRQKLQNTEHLDDLITEKLLDIIRMALGVNARVLIDGIRQPQIMSNVIAAFGIFSTELVWLDYSEEIRRERFEKRNDDRDTLPFDKAEERDSMLGLDNIERLAKTWGTTQP